MSVNTISPARLAELHRSGASIKLWDVRTPAEFQEIHVPFAENHPLERLSADEARRTLSAGETIYLICRAGSRGGQACQQLASAGLSSVVNVEGGTLAWESAGLPVVRGAKTISLERQVRIVAGALVVVGAVLSYLVHPYWAGLSAFVGAGLVFAGVTDTCGMAMMLAKMPWNQVKGSTPPGASCSVNQHAA